MELRNQCCRQHRADLVSDEFLKILAEDGCQSNGPPVIQACDFIFLWYGHNGGFFEAWGKHRQKEGKVEEKPQLVGLRMLGAHGLGWPSKTHSLADIHLSEGSCYIRDRNGECTHLFCSGRGSALCVGGVVSLEKRIKIIKLVW